MGVVRMAMGGHFFTDVVFAALFTFIIIVLAHRLIFRTQASDSETKTEPPSGPAP
jgi:membrane-associated phospholipid phosphatase